MTANTENTQLMNLFDKFLKDASKLSKVKKDTDCLISQIIAHMVTDECHVSAIQNLERIFQRPFDSVAADSSTVEEQLTIDATSPLKEKQKKIRAKKADFNSPAITDTVVTSEPKVAKGKPGRKAKTAATVEEPVLELVSPVVASACATPVLEEEEPKPKAKKTKAKKATLEVPTEESSKKESPKKEKKEKKEKKTKKVEDEDTPSKDLVAKLVVIGNTEETEELTEEDLLELLSDDED